jgi:hypothetical protein
MSPGNVLMSWLSAERSGPLRAFRDRILWFGSSTSRLTDSARISDSRWISVMSALGHIDVCWSANRWAIAPPVLTRLPALDGLAMLIGYRPARLLDALATLDADCDVWQKALNDEGGLPLPDAIYLQPASEIHFRKALAQLRSAVPELEYVPCSASALARALPDHLGDLERVPGPVFGADVELQRLNADALSLPASQGVHLWNQVTGSPTEGSMYRWREKRGIQFGILTSEGWSGGARSRVIFEYLEQIGEQVLTWKPGDPSGEVGSLLTPRLLDMPAVQRRAATLAFGQPPRQGLTVLVYPGLSRAIGERIARSVGQTLQEPEGD